MAVILETLSVKKLLALGVFIIAILCVFFIIGATKAPPPTNAMQHIATVCNGKDIDGPIDLSSCHRVDLKKAQEEKGIHPQDIVFAFQFPHIGLEMSRWHQFVALSVEMKLEYNKDNPYKSKKDGYPIWTFEAKLFYKDNNLTGSSWNQLAEATEERELVCHLKDGYYNCDDLPFFEIGSVFYNYYLVNVRLPGHRAKNRGIGQVDGLHFVEIHQNGGFTQMWFILKTVVSPFSIIMLVWFSLRVKKLRREILLLEKTLFMLGFITAFLNLPVEWLTLYANMPFMLLFTDIRQGLFYAMLMCFWVIFTGEHLLDQAERNKIKTYLPHVGFIGFGGFCLLVFDICERGYQLHNPFFSIWATQLGSDLAYGFIISAGVCAALYFLFLFVLVVKVFLNIRGKRATFKNMSRARRLNYEGLIFRFEFLMVMTLLCAALTVIFFIITNVNEAHWRFGEEESSVEVSSALFTGIYGMWNVYVLTIMFLYAPTASDPLSAQYDANRETVELTGTTDPTSGAKESIVYAMAGKASQE